MLKTFVMTKTYTVIPTASTNLKVYSVCNKIQRNVHTTSN